MNDATTTRRPAPMATDDPITYLSTLQFSWGGLFDGTPADDYTAHLVRGTRRGTPGPTLCGIDRFSEDTPGWSVGGGLSGPGIKHKPCSDCLGVAQQEFPGVPVTGLGHRAVARELGVPSYWHSNDIPAHTEAVSR